MQPPPHLAKTALVGAKAAAHLLQVLDRPCLAVAPEVCRSGRRSLGRRHVIDIGKHLPHPSDGGGLASDQFVGEFVGHPPNTVNNAAALVVPGFEFAHERGEYRQVFWGESDLRGGLKDVSLCSHVPHGREHRDGDGGAAARHNREKRTEAIFEEARNRYYLADLSGVFGAFGHPDKPHIAPLPEWLRHV